MADWPRAVPGNRIPEQTVDLAIVGGGINGVALAREALARGKSVCLLEKGDIGSGTSSRSSKMLHGGLRYLESLQLGLVFEALRERTLQLELAPHLAEATPFIIPVYRGSPRGRFWIRLGIGLYDLLAGSKRLGRARGLKREEILAMRPGLREHDLLGGGLYFDGVMDDARICLANFVDCRELGEDRFHGATYCRVESVRAGESGQPAEIRVNDLLRDRHHVVRARKVIRAQGPWTDEGRAEPLLSPSRGVHLILPPLSPPGAPPGGLLLTHSRDGRVFFVIPWRGKTLVGTTETPVEGSPDDLRVTEDEARYLLDEVARLFPGRSPGPDDILATVVGVRPLARAGTGGRGTGKISRKHRFLEVEPGVHCLVGGKYTNYRSVAESSIDELFGTAGRGVTRTRPLPGGELGPWARTRDELTRRFPDRPEALLEALHSRHGSRLDRVLALAERHPELDRPLDAEETVLAAEVVHGVLEEELLYPEDFLQRRTDLRYRRENGEAIYEEVEKLIEATLPAENRPADLARARQHYLEELRHEDRLREKLTSPVPSSP